VVDNKGGMDTKLKCDQQPSVTQKVLTGWKDFLEQQGTMLSS